MEGEGGEGGERNETKRNGYDSREQGKRERVRREGGGVAFQIRCVRSIKKSRVKTLR